MSSMPSTEPTVAIFGCGAVGLALGCLLAKAHKRPILIARGQRLAQLRSNGVVLHFKGEAIPAVAPDIVAAAPSEAPIDAPDILVITLKGHQQAPALADMLRWIGPRTSVIVMQNGIPYWYCHSEAAGRVKNLPLGSLPKDMVDNFLPKGRAHLGTVLYLTANERNGCAADGPLQVECGMIKKIVVGAAGTTTNEKAAAMEAVAFFTSAGIPGVEVSEAIRRDVWHKLLSNVGMNPFSALTLQPLGYMLTQPHAVAVVRACMEETLSIAVKLGVVEEDEISIDQRIALSPTTPRDFKTSMLQDVEAERQLEISPIIGAVLDIAEAVGVQVPTLTLMEALIRSRGDALSCTSEANASVHVYKRPRL